MATAFALLAGVLLLCWGAFPKFNKRSMKAECLMCSQMDFKALLRLPMALEMNGAGCSHHSECFSDCCLMDLDHGGTFCAPKARRAMTCLPQTKGATNIICPCHWGLTCISKDLFCPRRCQLI